MKTPKSKLRTVFALAAFLGLGVSLGAPLGCLPELPAGPPAEIPQVEIPQAPEVKVPEFQPPELPQPEGPELPVQPPPAEGNCCLRTGNTWRKMCGGAMSCCVKKFEDQGACQKEEGFWFFTPEGCAGAC